MRLRPSRLAAVAIIAATIFALFHLGDILYGTLNVPAYVGAYERRADIRYGTQPRQSLDVYVPSGGPHARRPVVVFWYGGTWTRGSKEQYRFVGAALAGSGYIAILPDYRLYPQVRFPQFVEDGALAVKWARAHAAELGGDASSIFLMGHSAGAHTAALLALDRRYLQNVGGDTDWVRGWIGLSGPYALNRYFVPGKPILGQMFRAPSVAKDWQVIAQVTERAPRTLLIHGTNDLDPRDVVALDESLRAAGAHVECRIYESTSHMTTVASFSLPLRPSASSLSDVRDFIDRSVAVAGDPHLADPELPCPQMSPGRNGPSSSYVVVDVGVGSQNLAE